MLEEDGTRKSWGEGPKDPFDGTMEEWTNFTLPLRYRFLRICYMGRNFINEFIYDQHDQVGGQLLFQEAEEFFFQRGTVLDQYGERDDVRRVSLSSAFNWPFLTFFSSKNDRELVSVLLIVSPSVTPLRRNADTKHFYLVKRMARRCGRDCCKSFSDLWMTIYVYR